ncbi:chromophore lyase CpcT/CpeT [Oscillatoria sp. FACHB-1406]|uniref:chromophore lyase CpcT/CpeT n=1 Tax=Oscillatoria sp. FACHB-1406 TaxID=2692846 RepID=UPI00168697C2|nr:chromophore lyase CpcT/CpeT [Oscillatoria sp. FACHB-1406]MBD2579705.1 chromophore lyase CpcT/CpeT [Oscillatoria sp. FACHB-1406]
MKLLSSIGIGIAIASCLNPTQPLLAQTRDRIPIATQVQAVVERLTGVMDTSAQQAKNPQAPNVRMTTCSVRVTDSEATFLYQEQALAQSLDRPYRQRFLRVAPSAAGDTVESKSYKPSNPQNWSGFCNKPIEERVVNLNELSDAECSVFLVPVANLYVGHTQAGGCATNVRGAVRITNSVFLHAGGMDTWDRGYDADGKQVWGAGGQAYQYRRAN